ncbi:transcriptional regulator (anti-sigma factor) [Terrihabitans soli]|uniref:Transcriptional regulator (Anti-sigma factor) n=1 Tax=Terrihabitans soli TaxID=708113 RepID=A0A6S6QR87_9HYPH|nr:hypothetical protein [Terrihabitans soli]BCJ91569.1 transcriptional regulator (anti-sigma factor) [Terrihabitans soli]
MAKSDNGIGDAELNGYVDGQLDAAGRIEVEDHLARHPELAARIMADLRTRDALRLAFPLDAEPAQRATLHAARKLESALGLRRYVPLFGRLAAAVVLFALGWSSSLGWQAMTRAPNQTAMLQEASRLGDELGVRLPRLPEGWQVLSAVRTDTTQGPGVRLTFRTPEFGNLSLIARATRDVDFVWPTVNTGEDSKIHWQLISDSYELTSNLSGKPLEFAALELYQTLY